MAGESRSEGYVFGDGGRGMGCFCAGVAALLCWAVVEEADDEGIVSRDGPLAVV